MTADDVDEPVYHVRWHVHKKKNLGYLYLALDFVISLLIFNLDLI